jgi:hypothetical protein
MSEYPSLSVPLIGECEIALMEAMNTCVGHFSDNYGLTNAEVRRAVDWLHAKYGTPEGER